MSLVSAELTVTLVFLPSMYRLFRVAFTVALLLAWETLGLMDRRLMLAPPGVPTTALLSADSLESTVMLPPETLEMAMLSIFASCVASTCAKERFAATFT